MKSVVLLDHVVVSGSRFLLSLMIARFLGLESFGVYVLIWTVVTFSASIQIPLTITPMMQIAPGISAPRAKSFYSVSCWLQVFCAIVSVPILSSLIYFITPIMDEKIIVCLSVGFYIFSYNNYEYVRRKIFTDGSTWTVLIIDLIVYTISIVSVLILYFNNLFSLFNYFVWVSVAPLIVVIVFMWGNIFTELPWGRVRIYLRKIWRIARPLLLSTVAGFISGHTFVYATAVFLGASVLGGITAAKQLLGPLAIIAMALENSMTREAVILHKNEPKKLDDYARRVRNRWLLFYLVVVLVIAVPSEQILTIVYGAGYSEYYYVTYWIGAAALMQIVTRVQTIKLRTTGAYDIIQRSNIYAMIASLLFAPVLVYTLGVTGAMLAIILQQGVIMLVQQTGISLFLGKRSQERVPGYSQE